mmetsp:Transcript_9075/g.21468  ORF Transcript_9075/g.21468 Transcript_9075/m.21468 type:complete len:208 (+) Transcript_9075:47-670(+)
MLRCPHARGALRCGALHGTLQRVTSAAASHVLAAGAAAAAATTTTECSTRATPTAHTAHGVHSRARAVRCYDASRSSAAKRCRPTSISSNVAVLNAARTYGDGRASSGENAAPGTSNTRASTPFCVMSGAVSSISVFIHKNMPATGASNVAKPPMCFRASSTKWLHRRAYSARTARTCSSKPSSPTCCSQASTSACDTPDACSADAC